jgi:hypothetical protein
MAVKVFGGIRVGYVRVAFFWFIAGAGKHLHVHNAGAALHLYNVVTQ